MTNKRIAVIGAGFAGLATAWHLSEHNNVTLIYSDNHSEGASEVSAGLLHPYGGAKAKNNWQGKEGVASTIELLDIASDALGMSVYKGGGILRISSSKEQEEHFKVCAEKNSDVRWLSIEECQDMVPGISKRPGIFIKSGITVYPDLYIEGLKRALVKRGVSFRRETINSIENLAGYGKTIYCIGAGVFNFSQLRELKLRPVKGQILQIPWPKNLPPLPYSLNSKIYMVMSQDNTSCYVGSTFERNFSTEGVDFEKACDYILPKLYTLCPSLEGIQPIDCKAGLRVATPNHLPLVKELSPNVWIFTGLGSKGLLYHSLLSKSNF